MQRAIGVGLGVAILATLLVTSVAAAQGPGLNYGFTYGGVYGVPQSVYGGYYGGVRGGFYSGPYYCYYEPLRGVGRDIYYYRAGQYQYKEYSYLGCPWCPPPGQTVPSPGLTTVINPY